jgi:hypothetical protein
METALSFQFSAISKSEHCLKRNFGWLATQRNVERADYDVLADG